MSRPGTQRLKVNPPLGMRPSLENHRIADLRVDSAYQRSIENGSSQTLVRRIAMFWDWALFQPLVVSRRHDGGLFVVDEQHRLAAARLRRDMLDLPCVVTSYASGGDEAPAFVALNQQRRPLGKIDLFKAALAAGDGAAADVQRLIEAAGLAIAPHTNWTAWKPGMVSNIAGIQGLHKVHGAALCGQALRVIGRAFEGQVLRFAGTIFSGLAGFLVEQKAAGWSIDEDLLAMVIGAASQEEWMQDLTMEQTAGGGAKAGAAKVVIARAYAEAMDEEAEAA